MMRRPGWSINGSYTAAAKRIRGRSRPGIAPSLNVSLSTAPISGYPRRRYQMRRDWYSASDLAGRPGIPGTKQGINDRAKRENWQRSRRQGRGGGYEYHLTSLPPITQASLITQRSLSPRPRPTAANPPGAQRAP